MRPLTFRSRVTQENMSAWAWPVDGWDALASDDELSDEAEHVCAVAEENGAAGEEDPVEGGSNADYLRQFGDA